jgi:hypothetical protein
MMSISHPTLEDGNASSGFDSVQVTALSMFSTHQNTTGSHVFHHWYGNRGIARPWATLQPSPSLTIKRSRIVTQIWFN